MVENSNEKKAASEIPILEWVAGGVGAVLVVATIGFLLFEGIAGDQSPPAITVRVADVAAVEGGYRVRFEASNQGGEAAAQVIIEGVIATGGMIVETSKTTLAYVPSRSQRGGGLFFSEDPRSAELTVRALGYEDP